MTEQTIAPVHVSGEAHKALAEHLRRWSGWRDAVLILGEPEGSSPLASTVTGTRTITVNPALLMLNPNRVLRVITPFRLRQEAVLTGALLHEAAHARYSNWLPRTEEAVAKFKHHDGTVPTKETIALARLMEEPRIEAAMAKEATSNSAAGLGWTMRAMAAYITPRTRLSTDPDQAIMDLIQAWTMRAGREYAMSVHAPGSLGWASTPTWVHDFTSLLARALTQHLSQHLDHGAAVAGANEVVTMLMNMTTSLDHESPFMVNTAREVLSILFPDSPPMPGAGGCGSCQGDDDPTEQGQEGAGSPSADSQPSDGGESASGDDEGSEESESEGGGGDQTDDQTEGDDGASPSTSGLGDQIDEELAGIEGEADETPAPSEDPAEQAESQAQGMAAGSGGVNEKGGWRSPTPDERVVAENASRFLRDLIDSTDSTKVLLTDTPSASIDGAAHAAWKASGGTRDPRFFRRTVRNSEPSPPAQIAVLVDVSISMSSLQHPSALLSWAMSNAALDLRNFAGRGVQIESTLIHWGTSAWVVQGNGDPLPGIRVVPCNSGTTAMGQALDLVEEQMPGFFDEPERPVNRLLVQFTDWELHPATDTTKISEALAAGVNMLTVAPTTYSPRKSALGGVLRDAPLQRGRNSLLRYNPSRPEQVWEAAASLLSPT